MLDRRQVGQGTCTGDRTGDGTCWTCRIGDMLGQETGTCDEGGPVGMAAQRRHRCRDIQNQVRLFGVQVLTVQVPQTDTGLEVGPVSVVGSVRVRTKDKQVRHSTHEDLDLRGLFRTSWFWFWVHLVGPKAFGSGTVPAKPADEHRTGAAPGHAADM